jgi:FAD/FMN-containing dehydrogenase
VQNHWEDAMHDLIRITAVATALLIPAGGFAAQRTGGDAGGTRLAQMCEEGSRDITGLAIEDFQRNIAADAEKRAALDALANATVKAAQAIKAACPAQAPLTAPARLAAMQARLEAMIAAVAIVKPPLEKFYGLLNDEQKEAIVALGGNGRQGQAGSLLDQDCGAAQPNVWPTADIERAVHPTEPQRASLAALQDAAAKAADLAKGSCLGDDLLTPTARLAAVGKRLDALLHAVKAVVSPLNDFYGMLDDGQKARFNAVSLPQTSQTDQPKAKPVVAHRRPYVNLGYIIRRFLHGF